MTCQDIRQCLPEFIWGELSSDERRRVGGHLEGCPACAEEARTVQLLRASRPRVPVGLETRIRAAVHAELAQPPRGVLRLEPRRVRRQVPAWALGAAALLALALGTPLIVDSLRDDDPIDGTELARVEDGLLTSVWVGDDGLVAGAPALDGLSDEALLALLEQLEEGV